MNDHILLSPQDLPGTLDALEPLAVYIAQAATRAGLTSKQAYGLRLAMDEVATNMATHGYAEHGLQGVIRVCGVIRAHELELILEDTAPAFDPRSLIGHGERIMQQKPEDRPIGGLGIYLAAKALDRFEYEYTGTNNRVSCVMKRLAINS